VGKHLRGDHVKIKIVDSKSGDSEWMWLLVDDSDTNNVSFLESLISSSSSIQT
jgi:hypothetical protein